MPMFSRCKVQLRMMGMSLVLQKFSHQPKTFDPMIARKEMSKDPWTHKSLSKSVPQLRLETFPSLPLLKLGRNIKNLHCRSNPRSLGGVGRVVTWHRHAEVMSYIFGLN